MKAGKILGIGCGSVVGLGLLSVVGVWFFMLRAPSPEDQCDHLIGLMKKESGMDLGDKFRAECLRKAEKGMIEGQYPYATRAKCILSAESLDQADKCGKTRSDG
jgi:hypothetical protein